MLRLMTDATQDPNADPLECRHCGSAGLIPPNPAGKGRPQITWATTECTKSEHKATAESMVDASDAWWRREKAERRAEREARSPGSTRREETPAPTPGLPPPLTSKGKVLELSPAMLLGIVLFLLVVLWLLAGAPTG